MDERQHNRPYVEIVEQPASKALRFRYICEGRSAGSIPGANSTSECRTVPSIRIVGYKGRAVIIVSCVTKEPPYRPHPHNLVGKDSCNRGVCTVEVYTQNLPILFANLGIQCVKRKDITQALKLRDEIRVDPFRNGVRYKNEPLGIDLNSLRLCFQVFLEGQRDGKFTIPLDPVVSDPIYDKKTLPELGICKLSHCSAPVSGGLEIIILCEKVVKDDIQVIFYETNYGQTVWKNYGQFHSADVHKQTAISLRTPPYRTLNVNQPIQVFVKLRRPSDGETSDSLPFILTPSDTNDPIYVKRKRQKFSTSGIINQHHNSDCNCNCGRESSGNNGLHGEYSNISKDNCRMSLLQHLQSESVPNTDKRQLAIDNCTMAKSTVPYSTMNNMNNNNLTRHPDTMQNENSINNIAISSQQIQQYNTQLNCNPCNSTGVTQMNNNYNDLLPMNPTLNPSTAYNYTPLSHTICNEPLMQYNNYTSQRYQELEYQQQYHQPNNYGDNNQTDFNCNQLNFDEINPIDTTNLYPTSPNDLDGFVTTTLSQFCSGLSITDTTEGKDNVDSSYPL